MKYTKNDHMRYLDSLDKILDPEAKELAKGKTDIANNPRAIEPYRIGQWMQGRHRTAFNRDYELRKTQNNT